MFFFYYLSFQSIKLWLTDGCSLYVTSKNLIAESEVQDTPNDGDREIEFKWINADHTECRFVINNRFIQKAIRSIGYYEGRRLGTDNISSKDFLDFTKRNPRMLQIIAREQTNGNAFLLQIKSFEAVFIEAQRIFKPKATKHINFGENEYATLTLNYTIDEIAEQIKNIIHKAKYDFLSFSQEKDNQFINKLLNDTFSHLSQQEYEEKRNSLNEKSRELSSFDLIDNVVIPEYSDDHKNELAAYIQDISEKFEKLEDICGKLKLFSDIIERKEFVAKKVTKSYVHHNTP